MVGLIISFATAAAAVLLGFAGLFLLTSSKHKLMEHYQNVRLSMSGRPLKDEDFPRMQVFALTSRLAGFALLLLGVGVLALAVVDY